MYVKLEEAKKHLLLDDSFKDDDLYILGLIDVAEDAVARNLNLKLDELAVDGEFTPPAVIHAILLLIGNLYANREPSRSIRFTNLYNILLFPRANISIRLHQPWRIQNITPDSLIIIPISGNIE